jgi:CRP/FNR family transcriptional regulator
MTLVGDARATAWTDARHREPRHLWQALIAEATRVDVPPCTALCEPEHEASAFAILDGIVRGFAVTPVGRQLTVRYARAGDLVGLAPALAGVGELCNETVTAAVVAPLPSHRLRALALREPGFGWSLAVELASMTAGAVRKHLIVQGGSTLSQVAIHLLEWMDSPDEPAVARVSHQQLAEATGTAREVVTRALANLRDAGIVETRRGSVIVLDAAALARVAGGDGPLGASPDGAGAQRTTTASTPPSTPTPSTSQAV